MKHERRTWLNGYALPAFRVLALLITALSSGVSGACAMTPLSAETGDVLIRVEAGNGWLHRFSLFQKNPPQIALWMETEEGNFAGTLFVSRKTATGKWLFNGGNPRPEALPVWMARKDSTAIDGVTGATPVSSIDIALTPKPGVSPRRFVLFAEVNHSTDFNDAFPKNAEKGSPGYSGGEGGSGQPSLVYRCVVDLDAADSDSQFILVGHGSPDGSSGDIYADLSEITGALDIVKSISAEVIE